MLRLLNPRLRVIRWPLKTALFLVVVIWVCFPDPRLLTRNLRNWFRLQELVEPDHPELQPWVERVRADLQPRTSPRRALAQVEAFVRQAVPYEWDWVTWGAADYLPTLSEMLALRPVREDCDGRAVAAASMLQKLGYDARLVTDLKHVWVWTPQGETMGPGGRKFVESDQRGTRLNWAALTATPANLAYGIAAFPWTRELIVLLTFWLLLLRRAPRWPWALLGLAVLLDGWLIFRLACRNPWPAGLWDSVGALLGWGHVAAAVLIILGTGERRRSRFPHP